MATSKSSERGESGKGEVVRADSGKKEGESLTEQFLKRKGGKEVKYRETVRDREKRRAMKGQACFRCEKFYQALNVDDPAAEAEKICNECSRHRDNEPINNTPEKFYNLDF